MTIQGQYKAICQRQPHTCIIKICGIIERMSTIIIDLSCFFIARIYRAWERSGDPNFIPEETASMAVSRITQEVDAHAEVVIAGQAMEKCGRVWQQDMSSDYHPVTAGFDEKMLQMGKCFTNTIDKMGIPIVCIDGNESDDTAVAITRRLLDRAGEVTIVSNSLRLLPLLDYGVRIREPFGLRRTRNWCRNFYGIEPIQMPDYLALVGCRRFVGVPGIGKKRARNVLRVWNNTETIIGLPPGNDPDINRIQKWNYRALVNKVMASLL